MVQAMAFCRGEPRRVERLYTPHDDRRSNALSPLNLVYGVQKQMSETLSQNAFVRWCRSQTPPVLVTSSGAGLLHGPHKLKQLKDRGYTNGTPDLLIPVPRGGYHSLWIEMKSPTGRLRPAQVEFITALREMNHKVVVCRSTDDAIAETKAYLNLPPLLSL